MTVRFLDKWLPHNGEHTFDSALDTVVTDEYTGKVDAEEVATALVRLMEKLHAKGVLTDADMADFVAPRFEIQGKYK